MTMPIGLTTWRRQAAIAVALGFAAGAVAAQGTPPGLAAAIEANTNGRVQVASSRPTPIPGLFEVTTKGLDLFYVDGTGRYGLVDGRLVDMRERTDLTAARLTELRSIDFAKLPLHLGIKHGNGSRVFAVFEDPTCAVCRSLHRFIRQIPDTTVYLFPFPAVTPDATQIATAAWCAADRAEAWERAMQQGTSPMPPAAGCDTSGLKEIADTGDALRVIGTPTVFLANGRRLQGALPPHEFLAALEESAQGQQAKSSGR